MGMLKLFGKMTWMNQFASAVDEGVLDGIFQLSDIPRPRVVHQNVHRLLTYSSDSLPRFLVESFYEVLDKKRDILSPLSERRYPDGQDVKATAKVLAELPLNDALLQVVVVAAVKRTSTVVVFPSPRRSNSLVSITLRNLT
jgi:hypothetical protein